MRKLPVEGEEWYNIKTKESHKIWHVTDSTITIMDNRGLQRPYPIDIFERDYIFQDGESYQEISNSQLSEIRDEILKHQNFKCAICQKDLKNEPTNNQHIDHQHLFKKDDLGEYGNGLIRGVLCRDCNALEGKIWNNIHRFGFADSNDPVNSRAKVLNNIISYYNKPYYNFKPILHPSEKRPEVLAKSEYNRLIKFWKTLDSSYKRNGELKKQPKYTKRWSKALKDIKIKMIQNNKRDLEDSEDLK